MCGAVLLVKSDYTAGIHVVLVAFCVARTSLRSLCLLISVTLLLLVPVSNTYLDISIVKLDV